MDMKPLTLSLTHLTQLGLLGDAMTLGVKDANSYSKQGELQQLQVHVMAVCCTRQHQPPSTIRSCS